MLAVALLVGYMPEAAMASSGHTVVRPTDITLDKDVLLPKDLSKFNGEFA